MIRTLKSLLVVAALGMIAPACGTAGPASVLLASLVVDSTGGTVTVTDPLSAAVGTRVVIPAGALAAPTNIFIYQSTGDDRFPSSALNLGFGPAGTTFSVPVTITIKYTAQYLTDIGLVDPALLRVVETTLNKPALPLQITALDTVNRLISALTTHFSSYAALGYTNATLDGTYGVYSYQFDSGTVQPNTPLTTTPQAAPKGFTTTNATVTFNGTGGLSLSGVVLNVDGASVGGAVGGGTYSVATDGTFSMTAGSTFTGTVLAGGSIVTFTSTNNDPNFLVAVKREGTFSAASLSGSYGINSYQYDSGAPQLDAQPAGMPQSSPKGFTSTAATVTFDGAGGLTLTGGPENVDGVAGTGPSGVGTYSVLPSGLFTMTSGSNFSGTLLTGGSVIVFTSTTNDPNFLIAVKKAGVFTDASLTGTYGINFYQYDSGGTQPNATATGSPQQAPLGFTSSAGTVTFDGAGNLTFTGGPQNVDGVTGTAANDTGTYSVAADGTFSMTAGSTFSGTVLDGGALIMFTSTNNDPQISIALRK